MNVECIFWIGLFTMNLHSFWLRTNILKRTQKVALYGYWHQSGSGLENIFINLIKFANFHNNLAILTLCKDKRNYTYSKPIKSEIVGGFVHSIGTQGKHYLWHSYHYFILLMQRERKNHTPMTNNSSSTWRYTRDLFGWLLALFSVWCSSGPD